MAKNGLGGFGDGIDGYVTEAMSAEKSAVAKGTACSVGGSYGDG